MSQLSNRIKTLLKRGVEYRAASALADAMIVVGSVDAPISSASTPRPAGTCAYWICAVGVTPTNAVSGDLIFNLAA